MNIDKQSYQRPYEIYIDMLCYIMNINLEVTYCLDTTNKTYIVHNPLANFLNFLLIARSPISQGANWPYFSQTQNSRLLFFLYWLLIYGMPIVISRGVWCSHPWAIWEIQDGRQYGCHHFSEL